MNKFWILSVANIRKCKGTTVALFLIIIIAVIILNLGVMTSLNFNKAIDTKAEEINSAHVVAVMFEQYYQDKYEDYFKSYPNVLATEKEEVLYLWGVKFKYGTGELMNPCIFMNTETNRSISTISFVGKKKNVGAHDIYLSYIMHTGGGYNLGDYFVISYKNRKYVFHIAGFTEDIHFGSVTLGSSGFYLPQETYQWFQRELKEDATAGILLKSRLYDTDKSQDMIADFNKDELSISEIGLASSIWMSSYTVAKDTRTTTAHIIGVIFIGFSMIVLLVSLLIMKYRVNTSIDEGMKEIGALKAMGFTNHQIMTSILLQYIMIASLGAVIGIMISFLAVGSLSSMFSAQTGIIWKQGFDLKSSMISIVIILISVCFMVPISVLRLKKVNPVHALRSGTNMHQCHKNYWSLIHMKGRLNFNLAMKSMLINMKQNVRVSFIIAAISFTCVFAVIVYYNIATNNKAFLDMIGTELCSVTVTTYPGEDANDLRADIIKMEGVKKAINYDYVNVTINDEASQAMIIEDYLLLDTNQVYEGRYPKNENEVVISAYMAKRFKKSIGDTIDVKIGDARAKYHITGLIQNISNIGMNISITKDGSKRLIPQYSLRNVNIYLDKGFDVDLFMKQLKGKYGMKIIEILDAQALTNSQLGIYVLVVTIFATIILMITALIVSLTLYLIIKAVINRRRNEFGIQKAIGYTNLQLMIQTSLSFLPIILLGTVLGSVLGSVYINPVISILFQGIGIMKVVFIVPSLWIIIMCICICILAFIVAMLVSLKIRKISAYTLMGD